MTHETAWWRILHHHYLLDIYVIMNFSLQENLKIPKGQLDELQTLQWPSKKKEQKYKQLSTKHLTNDTATRTHKKLG